MSLKLTDTLIKLFEPSEITRFRLDPNDYLKDIDISVEEKSALIDGDRTKLRLFSRVKELTDATQQFNRHLPVGPRMELTISELHVELQVNANENVAITGEGLLFVDAEGLYYKSEAVATQK